MLMIVAAKAASMTPPVEDRDGDPSAGRAVKLLVLTDKPLENEIGGRRNALSIRPRAPVATVAIRDSVAANPTLRFPRHATAGFCRIWRCVGGE